MSEELVQNTFNQWIYIDSDDYIGYKIKKYGLYDSYSIYFMRSLLKKINQPAVLDIGANIGNHLLPILPIVDRAIAFEPQPKTFDKLKRSIEKNGFENCVVENFGLGRENEVLEFYEDLSGNNGASSFVKESSLDKESKVLTLPIKNGDAVLDELKVQKIDFIKIDVEGFELEVFKGIEKNLKKFSPIILMEWHTQTTGKYFSESDAFNNLLKGYKVVALEAKYPWWVHNWLWSIRGRVDRGHLSKFKFVNFDINTSYNNILLYKDEHQDLIDDLSKASD